MTMLLPTQNEHAFAALKTDGSVVTWGDSASGGDSSAVASSLSSGVVAIYSNPNAFAALKTDGSVVTWGGYGGDSSAVASSLSSGVVTIYSNPLSFAALKADGSVVTWGESAYGGNSSAVAASLSSGVVTIYSTNGAFAALKTDGSVVVWGESTHGGDSRAVASSLSSGVGTIYSTLYAFAALKTDGSVVTWGFSDYGGNSSAVASRLSSGVVTIYSNPLSFAALKTDGSVVTWGYSVSGGDSRAVASSLSSGVVTIYSALYAFAALKTDGSVVTWGFSDHGGNSSAVASRLSSGVVRIYSNDLSFAALKTDGSVVTWGNSDYGGNSRAVASSLSSGVVTIYSTNHAFAALKTDGSVVTWGSPSGGGDSSAVAASLSSGVVTIYSTNGAFAALKTDGSVVTWGPSGWGGDSSAVASYLSSDVVSLSEPADIFIAASSAVIGEGNSGSTAYTFTVTRTGYLGQASATSWAVTGRGANPASATDFEGSIFPSGTVNFAAGQASQTITVNVTGDRTVEPDEGFKVTLSAPSSGLKLGIAVALGTILSDDTSLSIAADAASQTEGNSGTTPFTFTVTRSGDTSVSHSAEYAVAGSGAAPASAADFDGGVLPAGTVSFIAGQTSQTITVNVAGDTAVEADEGFTVTLSAPSTGATLGTATATGTIVNDDASLSIAALAASKAEGQSGSTALTFTVTRSGDTSVSHSAEYAVAGSGAAPASAADFDGGVLPAGTVSFIVGQTSQTVTVNVAGDTAVEADEGFTVTLASPSSGAVIGTATAAGVIQNDDVTTVSIVATDATKPEGKAGTTSTFTFTVIRGDTSLGGMSLPYAVTPGALRPANGADIVGGALPIGTVDFGPGDTKATISVAVAGDDITEPNENFVVTLNSPPIGVVFGIASANGTILADEPIGDLAPVIGVDGKTVAATPTYYAGPVGGVEKELILLTSENLVIAVAGANWFIRSGSGDDAIAVAGGTNVLDGGTGSNFLTGASGFDTFFVDARGATLPTWSTVNDFGKGDAATLWGVAESTHTLTWLDNQGAEGFKGLTLHASAPGRPTASLTLLGYDLANKAGALTVLFGFEPVSGSNYMYVLAN